MLFLGYPDFEPVIKAERLEQVVSDPSVLDEAEGWALDTIRAHLSVRYDVAALLGVPPPTGSDPDERSPLLVRAAVDLTLYDLLARLPGRMAISELRIRRYDEAMELLKAARDGKIAPKGWPLLPADQSATGLRLGGLKSRISNY